MTTLVDTKVYPSITVLTCKLVLFNKHLWDVVDLDVIIFGIKHKSI